MTSPDHDRAAAGPTRVPALIKIGGRHRKELGDLDELVRSIDDVGLLHPIVITPDNELIAGVRRLKAWPKTKFSEQEIPVHVVSLDGIVRGEFAENAAAEARARQSVGGKLKSQASGKLPTDLKGRATDKVSVFTGTKRRTLEKAAAVVDAANAEPEKYQKLLEQMDKTGKANAPFNRLRVERQSEKIRNEPPPIPNRGPYRVIVADPPWPPEPEADSTEGRVYCPYPVMTIPAICEVPVGQVSAPDCVLFLWVTNFHMRWAFQVLDAWGFRESTIITWIKNKMGHGSMLRGKTEHCIVAVRGKPVIDLRAQTTVLEGKVREHSQKPSEFFHLVETLCPASHYAEFWARGPARGGWDRHGDEVSEDETAEAAE
jgi:N6-adenosine-specific RNA methylase IME4